MTLTESLGSSGSSTAASATAADPFGLWQVPPPRPSGAVSFGGVGQAAEAEPPAAVWSLDLASGAAGQQELAGAQQELAERERQVKAVESGLERAAERMDALLEARAAARKTGPVSYGVSGEAVSPPPLPEPELFLSQALDQLEPPGGAVSFGLREDLSRLASTDWGALRARLEGLFDSVNRQLLHFVWVETNLNGLLAARTVVGWSGDLSTCCLSNLAAGQVAAHQQSLRLAMLSRSANLQTVITVSQLAAKIALAVTTPIGPIQALALAWEFVNSIVIPMVKEPSSYSSVSAS